jgi:hypothetical protein
MDGREKQQPGMRSAIPGQPPADAERDASPDVRSAQKRRPGETRITIKAGVIMPAVYGLGVVLGLRVDLRLGLFLLLGLGMVFGDRWFTPVLARRFGEQE